MSYIRLDFAPDDKLERSSSKDYAVHKTPTTISFIRQSSEITTMYQHIKVPAEGQKITVNPDFSLDVPDNPIIPYIEGDGTGVDISPVMIKVIDAAVAKAYGGKRKISWMEIYAGEKSTKVYGPDVWLPEETLKVLKDYVVSIKGPLTTPVGGGIRSLNVALRQELDLYVCLRPVRYFKGVPSPLREPEKTDMVIFRENSEDIYAGIEWQEGTDGAKKVIDFLVKEMGVKKIRFPQTSGIGVKLDAYSRSLREADFLDAHFLHQEIDDLLRTIGTLLPFDARIDIFGVLAEDHHVGLLGLAQGRRHALEIADRTQADIQVEFLTQCDVQ